MSIAVRSNSVFLVATAASFVFITITAGGQATTASPAVQLQQYTASDQSASAGVPSGWQVTQGQQTFIQMTGTQGGVPGTALTYPCRIPRRSRRSSLCSCSKAQL